MGGPSPALTPPRVLVVAATPYFADRGCHVRVQGQALGLERLGAEVRIVTYGLGRDVPGGRIVRGAGLPGYRRLDAAPALGKLPLDLFLLGRGLAEARRFRPDVIHGHTQEGGLLALLIGRAVGRPVVVDLQSRQVAEELVQYGASRPDGPLARLAGVFDRAVPRAARAVVASTATIAAWVRSQCGDGTLVEPLPDAVDVPEPAPAADPELALRLGLDPKRPIVAYLGLLTATQGVDLLLEAAARLAPTHPELQWLVMGYPEESRWRERAAALGLGRAVVLPGRIPFEQAPRHLALAALAVSPKRSITEGNGKLLLYQAAGVPALALDTPSNREVLGEDGWYGPDDPDGFAGAIAGALADPKELASRAARARERVRREASWEARARRLLALYDRIRA